MLTPAKAKRAQATRLLNLRGLLDDIDDAMPRHRAEIRKSVVAVITEVADELLAEASN